MILILLDLTAAFETIEPQLLQSRLESIVGLKDSVLSWLKSYLTVQYFSVRIGNFTFCTAHLESLTIPYKALPEIW